MASFSDCSACAGYFRAVDPVGAVFAELVYRFLRF